MAGISARRDSCRKSHIPHISYPYFVIFSAAVRNPCIVALVYSPFAIELVSILQRRDRFFNAEDSELRRVQLFSSDNLLTTRKMPSRNNST